MSTSRAVVIAQNDELVLNLKKKDELAATITKPASSIADVQPEKTASTSPNTNLAISSRIYYWIINHPFLAFAIVCLILATIVFLHLFIAGVSITAGVTLLGWEAVKFAFINLLEPAITIIAIFCGMLLSALGKLLHLWYCSRQEEKPTATQQLALATNALLANLSNTITDIPEPNPDSITEDEKLQEDYIELIQPLFRFQINETDIAHYSPIMCVLWLNCVISCYDQIVDAINNLTLTQATSLDPQLPIAKPLNFFGSALNGSTTPDDAATFAEPKLLITAQTRTQIQTEIQAYGELISKTLTDLETVISNLPDNTTLIIAELNENDTTLPAQRTRLIDKLSTELTEAKSDLQPMFSNQSLTIEQVQSFMAHMLAIQALVNDTKNYPPNDPSIALILNPLKSSNTPDTSFMSNIVTPCISDKIRYPWAAKPIAMQPAPAAATEANTPSSSLQLDLAALV